MAERQYRYRREDFGEMPVKLHHLDIYLNFLEGFVEATNYMDMTAMWELNEIELDANNLEIVSVEWCKEYHPGSEKGTPLDYRYQPERNKLSVMLPRQVDAGIRFCIKTITRCVPSDHVLEGIYKDSTPPGAPQQYVSQCQQWGFQRIMPIFDDCRAKCTMTTTIEADADYTHLISNGNIDRVLNPDGRAIPKPGNPKRQIIRFENGVPMAPYLFVVCAGTWDSLVDGVTYESGKSMQLEYLVPPGAVDGARIPMQILKESILWVARTQGYEYTGDSYRTITMNKSNFGGMENVGNTTIVTDAALIHEHTLDLALLYAHAVIVHEFEHNQCGSETTMETPFDVWLNEAYTVDVERQFMADVFDPSFIRLHQVDSIRNPLLGPLAIEDSGYAGRIVREGFNDPDELIDGVTYVKAAEVIRMLRLVVGPENFKAAKSLYFSRYHHRNANTDQFFSCFEEASGRSLEEFKKRWLYTAGYPKVTVRTSYDEGEKRYRFQFKQDLKPEETPFHLPIAVALVDGQGRDVPATAQVLELKDSEAELVLEGLAEAPAFASMNRDYSFYGTFRHENATVKSLSLQARLDPNGYNRVDAMRQLTDSQRIRLLLDGNAAVDQEWLTIYGDLLSSQQISHALKAYLLRVEEQPMDRNYSTWYQELVLAREKLMHEINLALRPNILQQFMGIDTYTAPGMSLRTGIEERMLKHVLLDLITSEDTEESHKLILDHFRAATTANDRVTALMALNRTSAPVRRSVLEEVYDSWHTHLSAYANYLRIVASGTQDDVFDMIELEKRRPGFDITQPTWCRALFLPMAANNKMVWTDRGIQWLTDTIVELAPINTTNASRLLNTFQHVKRLKPALQGKVRVSLEHITETITGKINPTIQGQAGAYLESLTGDS